MSKTTITARFNPIPGEPYGQCQSCEMTLQQESDAREHMDQTMHDKGPSHRIWVTNPPRDRRIRHAVGQIIDEALREAGSQIRDMIDQGHLTLDEARSVLALQGIDEDYLNED